MILPPVPSLYAAAGKWAVIALLGVALFLAGYFHARKVSRGETAQAQLSIALAYAGEIVANQNKADDLAAENAGLRAAQAPRDRIITKEITRYVEVTPPALRCVLPGTWRLRHDAAATGEPAAAEAGPLAPGTDTPVEDATALEIVGDNYQTCRAAIAKLEGWQRRYLTFEAKR